MSVNFERLPLTSGSGWWRLDPRVVAHLRARTSPLLSLSAITSVMTRRNADDASESPTAFAPTQWPETEWSDTCSDFRAG
jgi:hypothetical protein